MIARLAPIVLALLACSKGDETRFGASPVVEIEVPVVLELLPGPVPLVRATVDGRPGLVFLVDSGAQLSLIDRASADALGIDVEEHVGPWTTIGADGRAWAMDHYADLATIELGEHGGLTLRDVHVQVLDVAGARTDGWFGILGADVLARLVLAFDVEHAKLHVLPYDSTRAATERYLADAGFGDGPWGVVELAKGRATPFLALRHGDATRELEIDTGAATTSLPKDFVEELGLVPVSTFASRSVGGVHTGTVYRLEGLDLFGFEIAADVQASELDYGLFGMDILGAFVFVLDGPGNALWLSRRE